MWGPPVLWGFFLREARKSACDFAPLLSLLFDSCATCITAVQGLWGFRMICSLQQAEQPPAASDM